MAMRFLRDIPIKQKLTFITMLTSCVALLLACIAFVTYEQVTFRRTMVRDFSILADMFDDNVAPGLAFNDPNSMKQTLKTLSAHPHIVAAAVFDKSGKMLAKHQRTGLLEEFPWPTVRDAGCYFKTDRLDTFKNINLAGEVIGTVYIASDLEESKARFSRYALIVALVLVASSLVAFVLAAKLRKIISDPISHLAQVANAVAMDKDYSVRASKQGQDELGALIDGFNEMLVEIQLRDGALREARENLERRVDERTQELQLEVTERKQAEDALRSSEERVRLIMNTAFDAIVTSDSTGRILEWNTQAEKTFGWRRQEAMGRNLTETIIPPAYHEAHRRGLERLLATGEGPILNKRLEMTARHKDGHELPVELTISPVRTQGAVLFCGFLKDITERKQSEAQLETAHKKLLDASHQAGMAEVATGVLHNVGNVLNSVNVTATLVSDQLKKSRVSDLGRVVALLREHMGDLGEFLTRNPKGQKVPEYLAQLSERLSQEKDRHLQEMESLRKNIEHIKDIVAMQQSYAKVSGITEVLKVTDLVEDALRLNAGALARHAVAVIRDYGDVPLVSTDKHKVLQILVNLIRNAKYACDESGHSQKQLTVRVRNEESRITVSVIDNGVGIPAENLTRIFNHGFTTRKDGHGFGLHSGALAARELGGRLTVHSDGVGCGARFILELPPDITKQAA
jgi:PAS domain S-box-containing protein